MYLVSQEALLGYSLQGIHVDSPRMSCQSRRIDYGLCLIKELILVEAINESVTMSQAQESGGSHFHKDHE